MHRTLPPSARVRRGWPSRESRGDRVLTLRSRGRCHSRPTQDISMPGIEASKSRPLTLSPQPARTSARPLLPDACASLLPPRGSLRRPCRPRPTHAPRRRGGGGTRAVARAARNRTDLPRSRWPKWSTTTGRRRRARARSSRPPAKRFVTTSRSPCSRALHPREAPLSVVRRRVQSPSPQSEICVTVRCLLPPPRRLAVGDQGAQGGQRQSDDRGRHRRLPGRRRPLRRGQRGEGGHREEGEGG